jgi:hypothetical protein
MPNTNFTLIAAQTPTHPDGFDVKRYESVITDGKMIMDVITDTATGVKTYNTVFIGGDDFKSGVNGGGNSDQTVDVNDDPNNGYPPSFKQNNP